VILQREVALASLACGMLNVDYFLLKVHLKGDREVLVFAQKANEPYKHRMVSPLANFLEGFINSGNQEKRSSHQLIQEGTRKIIATH